MSCRKRAFSCRSDSGGSGRIAQIVNLRRHGIPRESFGQAVHIVLAVLHTAVEIRRSFQFGCYIQR